MPVQASLLHLRKPEHGTRMRQNLEIALRVLEDAREIM